MLRGTLSGSECAWMSTTPSSACDWAQRAAGNNSAARIRIMANGGDYTPAESLRRHSLSRLSSQAVAKLQSRLTVAVEIASASAISASFKPPNAQLDYTGCARIQMLEVLERIVHGECVLDLWRGIRRPAHERNRDPCSVAPGGLPATRVVDQNQPHLPGRYGEDVRPVLPLDELSV